MEENITEINKRLATIEMRMKTHWALQTDQEFAENYVQQIKNDLQAFIVKMALGAIVLLAGSGFIFIKYAVNEQFSSENEKLIKRLESSYESQIIRTDANFEWRRFHDYGKDYVNLAELYSVSPISKEDKDKHIHQLLDEAEGYFRISLSHGDMHASTYWELGELRYSYPEKMKITSEIDKISAIENYKDAAMRYTEIEIGKGWRAEAYYKIGDVYWDIQDDSGIESANRKKYQEKAKEYLVKAKRGYSRLPSQNDDRTKYNIQSITKLLSEIEKQIP